MTAIRTWNGTAWVAPHYCVTTFGSEKFKTYTAATQTTPYEWTFTSDNGGWFLTVNGANTAMPWAAGELIWVPVTNTYAYSPGPTRNELADGVMTVAGLTARCSRVATSGETKFTVNWYCEDWRGTSQSHVFTGAGQVKGFTFAATPKGYAGIGFQLPSYATGAEFRITDAYIRRQDGLPIGESTEAWIPKYWNGSAWVAQNAV